MNLVRAFSYVFDDPEWLGKLAVVVALGMMSAMLLPFFLLGALPLCILLGYMVEIVNNVRAGHPVALPRWDNLTDRLTIGAGVLLGLVVYNIPVVLMSCCIYVVPGWFASELTSGFFTLTSLCCIFPLMLVYIALSWPMVAVAIIRYARTANSGVFFRFGDLFETVRDLGSYSIQWMLCALAVGLIITLIPCIGWVIGLGLAIPVHGHLLGQYAVLIDTRGSPFLPRY